MPELLRCSAWGLLGLAAGIAVGGTAPTWWAAWLVALFPFGLGIGILVAREAK